jgi:hypothetical protein
MKPSDWKRWILPGGLLLLLLLILSSRRPFGLVGYDACYRWGRQGWNHVGMMGYSLGWLAGLLAILMLLTLGSLLLIRELTQQATTNDLPMRAIRLCPACKGAIHPEWEHCPGCGQPLT